MLVNEIVPYMQISAFVNEVGDDSYGNVPYVLGWSINSERASEVQLSNYNRVWGKRCSLHKEHSLYISTYSSINFYN